MNLENKIEILNQQPSDNTLRFGEFYYPMDFPVAKKIQSSYLFSIISESNVIFHLGSVHFSVSFSNSEQCSDLGGWVGLGKVTVQISSRKKWYTLILMKHEEKNMFCFVSNDLIADCFNRT